jgi:hypothetical protein
VSTPTAITTLTRLGRMLSTATDPGEMLQVLARASVEHLGASGAVVVQIGKEELASCGRTGRRVLAHGLPVGGR